MSPQERIDRFGPICKQDELKIPRSVQLAHYLTSNTDGIFASPVEYRQGLTGSWETVIFKVDVERPQHPTADIRRSELLATCFNATDLTYPEVFALRKDFPQVMHLNLLDEDYPKSFCLYSESFDEVRLNWTPAAFVRRIREWLTRAARGQLHLHDQPLEPLLLFNGSRLIVPHNLKPEEIENRPLGLEVFITDQTASTITLVANRLPEDRLPQKGEYLITAFTTAPVTHGIIRKNPKNLRALAELYSNANIDLIASLQQRIRTWQLDHAHKHLLKFKLILLVLQPRKRKETDTSIEGIERWAFLCPMTVEELGKTLNILDTIGGKGAGLLIGQSEVKPENLEKISIQPLTVHATLSAQVAGAQNQSPDTKPRLVAIGAGALGSQIILNLTRAGYEKWTIIDNDVLLPHNCARHALTGTVIGFNKAKATEALISTIFDEPMDTAALPLDVLHPKEEVSKLEQSLRNAEVTCDFSASVAVGKCLSTNTSLKQAIAVFITPDSNSLIFLAEDTKRSIRLDWLEMLHYRAVLNEDLLSESFKPNGEKFRYGNSCRDISLALPQYKISIFSGIATKEISEIFLHPDARCLIFHLHELSCGVVPFSVPVTPVHEYRSNNWIIRIDDSILNVLRHFRKQRLPNETGGILFGNFDTERRICSVVSALPSPPDSDEWPNCYIRGVAGLKDVVVAAEERTGGQIGYVGEWHSHPNGASVSPSGDDQAAHKHLFEIMDRESLPAIILIVGDKKRYRWMI